MTITKALSLAVLSLFAPLATPVYAALERTHRRS